jgi:hypothetical protein
MRKAIATICPAVLFLLTASCGGRAPQPEYRPTATIKDIMDSLVDPSADTLWESVETIVGPDGVEERAPRTDEEWLNVRRSAVRLVEATNLLQMPERHVARPGEKAENPDVELGPEDIEQRINDDRAAWIALAHGLHDAALPALTAIDARSVSGLFAAGDKIDKACENCHLKYWYPPDVNRQAPSLRK